MCWIERRSCSECNRDFGSELRTCSEGLDYEGIDGSSMCTRNRGNGQEMAVVDMKRACAECVEKMKAAEQGQKEREPQEAPSTPSRRSRRRQHRTKSMMGRYIVEDSQAGAEK